MKSVKNPKTFPARIHVLLARDAPVGLVIRRGPAKHVCFVKWDRSTNEFTVGQWLKGRIYERRCDLSPDGQFVIYFASKGYKAWSAISRAPYLKAIGLWKQSHHYSGGGLFLDDGRYWLNAFLYTEIERPRKPMRVDQESVAGECLATYYPRLERDGWKCVLEEKRYADYVHVFEKQTTEGCTLRKICHALTNHPPGAGCFWDEHELEDFGNVVPCPNWEWADVDGTQLLWASAGRLCTGKLTRAGEIDETELHDFNGMKFEAIAAPY